MRESSSRQSARRNRRRALAAGAPLALTAVLFAWLALHGVHGSARIALRGKLLLDGASFMGAEEMTLQQSLSDCGPAALANLLRALGRARPSLDSLSVLAGTDAEGTWASGLVAAGAAVGVALVFGRLSREERRGARPPFIAWVDGSHFVTVVDRAKEGRLVVEDPLVGRYSIAFGSFEERWGGEALLPAQPPRSREGFGAKSNTKGMEEG